MLRSLHVGFSVFDAFWAGFFVAVASFQLYHFFRPIDVIIVDVLCATGVGGIILNREMVRVMFRRAVSCGFLRTVLVMLPILVIAVRCGGPAVHYDTGFYGATAVGWF